MAKSNRNTKQPAKRKPRYRPPTPPKVPNAHQVIRDLAAKKGINFETQLDDIIEAGKGLFRSDEELELFIESIYAERRRGRGK